MSQTAPEINLLKDSRGFWYNPSDRQVILAYLGGLVTILGTGVLLGTVIGQYLLQNISVVQATEAPPITLTPTPTTQPTPAGPTNQEFTHAQQKIAAAAGTPLNFIYQTKREEIIVNWPTEIITRLLTTSIWGGQVNVAVNHPQLETEVARIAAKLKRESQIVTPDSTYTAPDRTLDKTELQRILRDELFLRLRGEPAQEEIDLTPLVKEVAGSNGTLAPKYIEVDISQQKLYQWEDGEVVATRIISTGKQDGWTPIGVHKIMNKAANAWSPTASVYTPYWMAYGFLDQAGAYVGFHGMPFNYAPEGKRLYRSFDTLGEPVTGGCIQLADNDAIALMDWAEVGMEVLVHE